MHSNVMVISFDMVNHTSDIIDWRNKLGTLVISG
jgi:hypothetical protein